MLAWFPDCVSFRTAELLVRRKAEDSSTAFSHNICNLLRNWPESCKKLKNRLGDFSAEFTKDVDDATTITRRALLEGYETIIAVGGDGTANEVVNGFFENENLINSE
ncbi:MAG: acylglycerol kinase family protein, partial [Candidatus Binatia bacterium]